MLLIPKKGDFAMSKKKHKKQTLKTNRIINQKKCPACQGINPICVMNTYIDEISYIKNRCRECGITWEIKDGIHQLG